MALLNGTIKATIVDLPNKNIVMEQAPDRFHQLPGLDDRVSDEILFANAGWVDENPEAAAILVEELLRFWREVNDDPAIVEQERAARGLLADQPQEILDEVDALLRRGRGRRPVEPGGRERSHRPR